MTNDGLTLIHVKSMLSVGGPKEWITEGKARLCFGSHAVNGTERLDAIKTKRFMTGWGTPILAFSEENTAAFSSGQTYTPVYTT